jgi:hypothetical protein
MPDKKDVASIVEDLAVIDAHEVAETDIEDEDVQERGEEPFFI